MANDEVEIGGEAESDDYEVVPVGPIKKLERRIDEIETQASGSRTDDELIRDVLDIMKSNQKIVNDMTESTHELKNQVEDLTHKMDSVIDNMNQFIDLLEEASEADLEGEVISDVHSKIADAVGNEMKEVSQDIQQSNEQVINHLEQLNKSIKRSSSQNKLVGGRNNSQRTQGSMRSGMNVNRNNNERSQQNASQGRKGSGNSNNSSGGQSNSERMNKLKERFNDVQNNE